jgi:hypothetical protein
MAPSPPTVGLTRQGTGTRTCHDRHVTDMERSNTTDCAVDCTAWIALHVGAQGVGAFALSTLGCALLLGTPLVFIPQHAATS